MPLYESFGRIAHISKIQEGQTKGGFHWRNLTLVLEMDGFQGSVVRQAYRVGTDALIDRVKEFSIGDKVTVSWSFYSREYDDRWYNSVDLVRISAYEGRKKEETKDTQEEQPKAETIQRPKAETKSRVEKVLSGEVSGDGHEDDLPF